MSEHPEQGNGFVNPSVKYEHTDLSLRAVLIFSGALVAALVVVSIGLYFMVPSRPQAPFTSNEEGPWKKWNEASETAPPLRQSQLPPPPELEAIDRAAPPSEGGGTHTRPIQEQIKDEEDYLNLSPFEDLASSLGASAAPANGALLGLSRFSARGVGHVPIEAAMRALAGGKP